MRCDVSKDVSKKLQKAGSNKLQAFHEARKFCHLSNDLNGIFDKLEASDHLVSSYYNKETFLKVVFLDKFKHSKS